MSESQVDEIYQRLCARHEGETIEYASCPNNGCFDMCVLRQHVKNGRVTAIETDNSIHVGMGREDEYCNWKDIQEGMYQKRACVRGRGQRSDTYSPTRLLYPMRRIGPKPSYEFERISWDEALDSIADLVRETREKYGPLSVYSDGMQGQTWDHLGKNLPGGAIATWAEDSFEPTNTADWFTYGYTNQNCFGIDGLSENQTFFDSKLIILIGFDAAVNYPETVYYLLMAKEKGVPIITIDPRYTWTAEAIGTQHIFIRPGTDLALICAMAYVLFDEDVYDKEFCEKWVEPKGLELWRDYIMGASEDDKTPKTPEWAEGICGIPAETIRDLALLYAASSPCYIRMVWAAARQLYGKQAARGLNYLQALGGNIGHNGCAGSGVGFSTSHHLFYPYLGPYLGEGEPKYGATVCMEAEMWHRAILLREKLEAGEITEEYYKGEIGCPKDVEAPNIHLMFCINSARNHLSGWYGCNERREALLKVDHMVYAHWNLKSPQIPYADIVIPVASPFLEGVNQIPSSPYFGSYTMGLNTGTQNALMYGRGGGEPLGEARPMSWIMKQLAVRLGIGDCLMPAIPADTPWDEYPDAMEKVAENAWNIWKNMSGPYGGGDLPDVPEWEEFRKNPIYRVPMKDYHVFARQHIEGGAPFPTKSGKIEFYSDWIAENDLTEASLPYEGGLKCFGHGDLPPMAIYKHTPEGMMSPKTQEYPLYMVTPHSFYRHHCAYDHSLWYRDEFRNSVWISVPDAKARNIKDGDKVRVFSSVGESFLTAYVTSRMTPGVCCIIFGRWYEPSDVKTKLMPGGVDTRGDCNMLIPSEFHDDVLGALLCNALVQIESIEPTLHLDELAEVK
ncbi:MAG: molybdopterin-dependent oxidoreductase [Eggerthellaceae bacterium]|nr:molybdopterin-dependent oxidoreductase [Eggerthellaceae bacterium]